MEKLNQKSRLVRIFCLFISAIAVLAAFPAAAQTTTRYTNSVDSASGGITNANACSVAAALQRDFVVTDNFAVQDVNLGVLLEHGDRDDVALFLRSPAGNIITAKVLTGGAADNYNVLLDDQAPTGIAAHTANDIATATTVVPPYQRTFAPANSLNAGFAGQNSAGTWTLFICDFDNNGVAGGDGSTGTFFQADLFLTPQATGADLELTKTVSNPNPPAGSNVTYTLTVSSSAFSVETANGVQVRDVLPAGAVFVSASGTGSYNSATGIWDVGSVAPNGSASLDIVVTVDAPAASTITNNAEIIASSATDPDSTVNNGSFDEDDDASAAFTVQGTRTAGVAPALICPAGSALFDWDTRTWAAGSLDNIFAVAGLGDIRFQLTNDGTYLNNAALGGQSPNLQTIITGGQTGQQQLIQLTDMNNINDVATTTITLPSAVEGVQFTLADIDHGANQFADRVRVTGFFNGAPINPVLTNGTANFVIGNEAFGDIPSDSEQPDGNNFNIPANPGQQAITIQDITLCNPVTQLAVTKISQVISDPINGTNDPKAIPGATVRYCIIVNNAGNGTATNIVAGDILLPNISYIPGSLQSGSNCSGTLVAEDDDSDDAAETDPFTISYDPDASPRGAVTGLADTLGPDESFAILFRVTVD
jgi:uncharacterized repeat protein (TIGR01451 family)